MHTGGEAREAEAGGMSDRTASEIVHSQPEAYGWMDLRPFPDVLRGRAMDALLERDAGRFLTFATNELVGLRSHP